MLAAVTGAAALLRSIEVAIAEREVIQIRGRAG